MAKPTIEQVSELHRQIESGRISREALQAFLRNPGSIFPADPTFKVVVDYGMTFEAMIAAGHYEFVAADITPEHFPIRGRGKPERKLVLVQLYKMASTDEALAELDCRGLRPAKIEELLALGASRPELQKEFPIVALGSLFVDSASLRLSPCLDQCGAKRSLDWRRGNEGWGGQWRFLAVRQ